MQHSTGQYDDLARVPTAPAREGGGRRTTAWGGRRRSPPRCSCRVVPPIRDARFVDLNLAVFMCNSARRQERVCRAQRRAAKIDAIATFSRRQRPQVPHLNRGNARKLRAVYQRPANATRGPPESTRASLTQGVGSRIAPFDLTQKGGIHPGAKFPAPSIKFPARAKKFPPPSSRKFSHKQLILL